VLKKEIETVLVCVKSSVKAFVRVFCRIFADLVRCSCAPAFWSDVFPASQRVTFGDIRFDNRYHAQNQTASQ
jgi:hypothetical protein